MNRHAITHATLVASGLIKPECPILVDCTTNDAISELVELIYSHKYKTALSTSKERLAKIKSEREFADHMLQYHCINYL